MASDLWEIYVVRFIQLERGREKGSPYIPPMRDDSTHTNACAPPASSNSRSFGIAAHSLNGGEWKRIYSSCGFLEDVIRLKRFIQGLSSIACTSWVHVTFWD